MRLIVALVLVAVSLPSAARGQPVTSMSVDAVGIMTDGIQVTGVVQGTSTPTTVTVNFVYGTDAQRAASMEHCHRMLLLALGKPGQYHFSGGGSQCVISLVKP